MIDLFAGCGGLSLGMENAGFSPFFASELNKDAMDSYLANRPHLVDSNSYCYDIEDLVSHNGKKLKAIKKSLITKGLLSKEGKMGTSLDLVCGGPPCQGFSGIGHRRSYGVDKQDLPSNQLFHKMLMVIKEFQPKLFLFENVKGLLSAKWTSADEQPNIWKQVYETYCEELPKYTIRWELVRAKDYGVPQNRPRILMVGVRNDVLKANDLPGYGGLATNYLTPTGVESGFLPQPTPNTFPSPEELIGDLVDSRVGKCYETVRCGQGVYPPSLTTTAYPRKAKKGSVQEYFRTNPHGGEVKLQEQEYSKHKQHILEKFRLMIDSEDGSVPEHMRTKKFAQRVLRRRWPDEGPNITATSLPDDYVHYSQPRILTVREWARLQMFPDWYVFKGKRTTGGLRRAGNPREGIFDREVPKYTQIGNAVPVRLAESVGRHFVRFFE